MALQDAAIAEIQRVYREFRRYTGDGLPAEPLNAILPIGDPQSGPHSPKKSEIRAAHIAVLEAVAEIAELAEQEADRAEEAASLAISAATLFTPTIYATQALAEAVTPATAADYIQTMGGSAAGDGDGAIFRRVGSEPAHDNKFSQTLADTSVVWFERFRALRGEVIVIVAMGQSNIAITEPLDWTPPPNLYEWNWLATGGVDETDVGTGFTPGVGTSIGAGSSYAAEVAKANPGTDIYLINIGRGALAIAQWMTGASTPDMYSATKQNVEAALAMLAVDHVDRILWWQGESDYQLG